MNGSVSTNEKEAESNASHQPPLTSEVKGHNSMRKKEKKKKKKQKHKEAGPTNTVVTSDPTSTTNIPDYARFVHVSCDKWLGWSYNVMHFALNLSPSRTM